MKNRLHSSNRRELNMALRESGGAGGYVGVFVMGMLCTYCRRHRLAASVAVAAQVRNSVDNE